MELTEEQKAELGIQTGGYVKYGVITCDNGDNKSGMNATGEYVIKTKNQQGQFIREQFGSEMSVVILAVRAKVNSKFKKDAEGWYTNEFISGLQSPVVAMQGSGDNKKELFRGTYEELRNQFSVPDGTGGITKNFVYSTILYVYHIEKQEVFKVLLRGKSQGKFFDYSSSLKKEDTLLSFETLKGIGVEEDEDGKENFYATFIKGPGVDVAKMFEEAKGILSNMQPTPSLLNAGQQAEQLQQTPQTQTPQTQQAPQGLRNNTQDAVVLDEPVNESDIAGVKF